MVSEKGDPMGAWQILPFELHMAARWAHHAFGQRPQGHVLRASGGRMAAGLPDCYGAGDGPSGDRQVIGEPVPADKVGILSCACDQAIIVYTRKSSSRGG